MFPSIVWEGRSQIADYKTQLQELVQQQGTSGLEYRIVDEHGPAHEKEFIAEVWMEDQQLGKGSGRSKKEAEQQAAAQALSRLGSSV
ncbi:Ribonuclease 3 [compost metagenome]